MLISWTTAASASAFRVPDFVILPPKESVTDRREFSTQDSLQDGPVINICLQDGPVIKIQRLVECKHLDVIGA